MAALAPLVTVAFLTACGDDASADEERVCAAVQTIVDRLAGQQSVDAIVALGELEAALGETANATMATAGTEFFDVLDTDVDRFELTLEEVGELGRRFQAEGAAALDVIVAECREVGTPIEGLPTT